MSIVTSSADYGHKADTAKFKGTLRYALQDLTGGRQVTFATGISEISAPRVTRGIEVKGGGHIRILGGNGVTLLGKGIECLTPADIYIRGLRIRPGAATKNTNAVRLLGHKGLFRAEHCTFQDCTDESAGGNWPIQEYAHCIFGPNAPDDKGWSHGTRSEIHDPDGYALYDGCLYAGSDMRQGRVVAGVAEWRGCVILYEKYAAEIDYPKEISQQTKNKPRGNWINTVFVIGRNHKGDVPRMSALTPIAPFGGLEPGCIYVENCWTLDMRNGSLKPVDVRTVHGKLLPEGFLATKPHTWPGRVQPEPKHPADVLSDVLQNAGCPVRDDAENEAIMRVFQG